ncbi:MAG: ImmA/IrrE family metallo-endopeptidase [Candidatus Bathyarchaeota archaeon]|nr:ImmA/IrrE family metallo-endopeptidase [Candidatus Bathyarchaeota archaeon]
MADVTQTELARQGLSGALKARLQAGSTKKDPVCVYDLAAKLGLEVRFIGGKSFGGMYSKISNVILIPSLRPPGRRSMTCAHEIGHWFFGHGSRLDAVDDEDFSDNSVDDRLANFFGHNLLMPPWTVKYEFHLHSLDPRTCGPIGIYKIANQLGVAYGGLVRQLHQTLHAISRVTAKNLLDIAPAQIRADILSITETKHLVIADTTWHSVPIDLEVGDYAILPLGADVDDKHLRPIQEGNLGLVLQATSPGISNASVPSRDWATFIRVSRREFTGLSMYRHLEEADDETDTPDRI